MGGDDCRNGAGVVANLVTEGSFVMVPMESDSHRRTHTPTHVLRAQARARARARAVGPYVSMWSEVMGAHATTPQGPEAGLRGAVPPAAVDHSLTHSRRPRPSRRFKCLHCARDTLRGHTGHVHWSRDWGRGALEGKGPQRRP